MSNPLGRTFNTLAAWHMALRRRLQNIDAIDFREARRRQTCQRHGPDLGGQTVPAGRRRTLVHQKAGNNRAFGQNHRRRNHGTGKAAPPGFIDPGNRRNGYAGEPVARLRGRAQKQLFLHGYGFLRPAIHFVTKRRKRKKGSLQERSFSRTPNRRAWNASLRGKLPSSLMRDYCGASWAMQAALRQDRG